METNCDHNNLVPHVNWNTGKWYWTCSDCYCAIANQWVTDEMRKKRRGRSE